MKFYSTKEVTEMLSIHINTLMNYINSGKLKAIKIGGVWRIKKEDLEKFIEGK